MDSKASSLQRKHRHDDDDDDDDNGDVGGRGGGTDGRANRNIKKKPRRPTTTNTPRGGGRNNYSNSSSNNRNRNNNSGGRGQGRGRGRGRGGSNNNNNNRNKSNNNKRNDANINKTEDDEMMDIDVKNNNNNDGITMDTSADATATSTATATTATSRHQFSDVTFDSQTGISNESKRALREILNYEYMTKVQAETLPTILAKKDVLAKSKTGSGKTTSFLLPIIENFVAAAASNNKGTNPNKKGCAVIIAPTRELANQISVEYTKLTTFHKNLNSQYITMIGGTNIEKDKKKLLSASKNNNNTTSTIRVIIATPGRLLDHITQNTADIIGNLLSNVEILCLDEADRLLDMGFRQELIKIISYMPQKLTASSSNNNDGPSYRQTLLFSATFPNEIKDITKIAMRSNYIMIDCLNKDEVNTNEQVVQKYWIVPQSYHILALQYVLRKHIEIQQKQYNQPYKIIVFFTTARIAQYMAELFRTDRSSQQQQQLYDQSNLLEMHSRKSQSYRTNVANQFTKKNNLIMFSSDVSARGVDYPNVTCVVQVGAPSEKAQYIHRLGRTARAGNSGIGILILNDFESVFVKKEIRDLNIQPYFEDNNNDSRSSQATTTSSVFEQQQQEQQQSYYQHLLTTNETLQNNAKAAYQAFLGYYNSNIKRLNIPGKEGLVRIANEYSTVLGFPSDSPPAIQAKTIGKMGLKGVPGLTVESNNNKGGGGGRGGRGGGEGGGRGGRGGGSRGNAGGRRGGGGRGRGGAGRG